jgi:hypothetical protein
MARTRIYNHTRFDGGMTHNKRDTSDLTKFALLSHLDIYRDHSEMHVMPGFVSDNGFDGSATGVKVYNIQSFGQAGAETAQIFALGKKSDGTGSKILTRILSGTEWTVPAGGYSSLATEGTADLLDFPFFWNSPSGDFHYPVKSSSNTAVAQHGATAGDYNATWQAWLTGIQPTGRTYAVRGFTGDTYLTKGLGASGISLITASAVTSTIKASAVTPAHIASGNYQIGIVGTFNSPRRSQVLLWDSASLLADQNLKIGKGTVQVIGTPSEAWATVSVGASSTLESNGRDTMSVRVISGESTDILYQLQAVSPISINTDIFALNDTYQEAMLWYARPEVSTGEYIDGIWSFGRGSITGQFGLARLFDTSSLGIVRNAHIFGESVYFCHGGDGSVSRLDNFETGTYNVPATIETLIYGADSPYLKSLKGISIVTENLPSGGSVVCSYRTDEDSAWVTMGTSDTVGKQKHSFTKANGTPIGKFQEIQFKIVITGKVTVKNILVAIEETEDLPF